MPTKSPKKTTIVTKPSVVVQSVVAEVVEAAVKTTVKATTELAETLSTTLTSHLNTRDFNSSLLSNETLSINSTNSTLLEPSNSEESLLRSFSIAFLLDGLDYIFYIWTVLLVTIVTYLSFYKYYQYSKMNQQQLHAVKRTVPSAPSAKAQQQLTPALQKILSAQQARQISATSSQQTSTHAYDTEPLFWTILFKVLEVLKVVLFFLFGILKSLFSQIVTNASNIDNNADALQSFSYLNNFLKWFYFSSETTRNINNTIINFLNEHATSLQQQQQQKTGESFEDFVYFKSVETIPPKFTNMRTIVNENDNLTMKANLEFANVDFKLELRKQQQDQIQQRRQVDLKLQNVKAQVIVILSHLKNTNFSNGNANAFNIDFFFDPETELHFYFRQDLNLEQHLVHYAESLIKAVAKQFVLSLEFNISNKKVFSDSKLVLKNPQVNISPNSNNSSSVQQQQHAKNSLNINANTNNQAKNNGKSLLSVSPNTQQQQALSNTNTESNASSQNTSPQVSPGSASTINNSTSNDLLTGGSYTISELRSNMNEKRLLVKLLKATNLANCEEPYCVIELDYPMQKHITEMFRDMSTINEQFIFDITANSEELSFSIFDKAKDYGNDLIGEAVLPVNDLCSNLNSKRVIQLHRYGQTRSGSVTAEFAFVEPMSRQVRDVSASRNNNQNLRPSGDTSSLIQQYREEILHEQQKNQQLGVLINRDNASNNSTYATTTPQRSPNGVDSEQGYSAYVSSINKASPANTSTTNVQLSPNRGASLMPQQQQVSPLNRANNNSFMQSNVDGGGTRPAGGLISTGSLKRNKTNQLGASNHLGDAPLSTGIGANNLADPKTKSLSRSLKSLFIKPSSNLSVSGKRDKSYDSNQLSTATAGNNYDIHSIDVHTIDPNLQKARTGGGIGGSLRRLFHIKTKNQKKYQGTVHDPKQTNRPGPSNVSITVTRPMVNNTSTGHQFLLQSQQQAKMAAPQQQQHYQMNMPSFGVHQQINQQQKNMNMNMRFAVGRGVGNGESQQPQIMLNRGYITP